MSGGKIASQVAHAAISLFEDVKKNDKKKKELNKWKESGSKKIILKNHEKDFSELKNLCEQHSIPYTIITDAGRTEIPYGSETVFALWGTDIHFMKIFKMF